MTVGGRRASALAMVLTCALVWGAEEGLVLTGSDVLCRPGEEAVLAVKVENAGWRHKDAEGARVSAVLVDDGVRRPLADVVTDDDGWAEFPVSLKEPGVSRVLVAAVGAGGDSGKRGGNTFLVVCRNTDRLGVVLDIDDTLTASDAAIMDSSPPVRDADTISVVTALAERYDIVYLTGRVRWDSARIRQWLWANGFPPGPLFVRDLKLSGELFAADYKRQTLRELRRHFPNIVVGVGDEDGDAEAYTDSGMVPILIEEEESEAWNVERWSQIRELLLGDAVTFTSRLSCEVTRGGKPWGARCTERSGQWALAADGLAPAAGSWAEVRGILFEHLKKQGADQ